MTSGDENGIRICCDIKSSDIMAESHDKCLESVFETRAARLFQAWWLRVSSTIQKLRSFFPHPGLINPDC